MMAQVLLIAALAVDLNSIRNEPNLERRSDLALDHANAAIDQAEQAYKAGQPDQMRAELKEAGDSVDLAYDSLVASGKNARHDKGFKKAEQRTRALMRRLAGFRELVDFDDRAAVEKIRDRVAEVNDNLLNGIMRKK
jgi:hypothetical protein